MSRRVGELLQLLVREEGTGDEVTSELVTVAQQNGLDSEEQNGLLEVVLGTNRLPDALRLRLLEAFIPNDEVDCCLALQIASCLGEGAHSRPADSRVDYSVQNRLLRQLDVLHDSKFLGCDGAAALRRCYHVLEKLLDYETLRDSVADLLVSIMSHKHATSQRLAKVADILNSADDFSPSLLRLEAQYRSFLYETEPQGATEQASRSDTDDPGFGRWRSCVYSRAKLDNSTGDPGKQRANKRRKLMHHGATSSDLELLARKIDRPPRRFHLELPTTLAKRQYLVDSVNWTRASSWKILLERGFGQDPQHFVPIYNKLSSLTFQYQSWSLLQAGTPEADQVEDPTLPLLRWLPSLSEVGGELPEPLQSLFFTHLTTWDGRSHLSETFRVMVLLKPLPYDTVNQQILAPLAKLASDADEAWISGCIHSVTTLVLNWASRDDLSVEVFASSAFGSAMSLIETLSSLQRLLEFLDGVIEDAITRSPNSLAVKVAALGFYEASLDLSLVHMLPVVVVPCQAFAYSALFSGELSSVSRMTGVIARLREALTGDSTAIPVDDPLYTEPINALNTLLVDFGGPLWKRKFLLASAPEEGNAGMGLSETQLEQLRTFASKRDQSSSSALGLTTHGALASLAVEFLQTLAKREGKQADELIGSVSVATLKHLNSNTTPSTFHITFANFRPLFLEHLRDKGATGLYEFLFSTMQSLIKRRESQSLEAR